MKKINLGGFTFICTIPCTLILYNALINKFHLNRVKLCDYNEEAIFFNSSKMPS